MKTEGTLTQGDIIKLTDYNAAGVRQALEAATHIKPVYRHAKLCLYSFDDLPEIKKVVTQHKAEARDRMVAASRANLQAAQRRRLEAKAKPPAPAPTAPASAVAGPVVATLSPELVGLLDGMFVEHTKEVDEKIRAATDLLTQQHRILMQHIEGVHKLVAKLASQLGEPA